MSGISLELDTKNKNGLIRYSLPDDVSFSLPQDVELGFTFGMTFPSVSLLITEASVNQHAFAQIKLKEPRTVTYFSSIAFKLCNFLSLATNQAVGLQSMTGYLYQDTPGGPNKRSPIRIYGQFAPWPERKPKFRPQDVLFRYPDVANNLGVMLTNWFESHEIFEPAFNLYFASKMHHSQFLNTKVLWLTQALETLHRRSSSEKRLLEGEFASLCDSLMENCPQNRRLWLSDALRYANEISLRQRMKRLLDPFERWFGDRDKRKAFVSTACDTRNYYTHYDETNTENRAKEANELFELYGKLEALFQLHLLKLIGLDDPAIDSIVQENRVLRRKLGV